MIAEITSLGQLAQTKLQEKSTEEPENEDESNRIDAKAAILPRKHQRHVHDSLQAECDDAKKQLASKDQLLHAAEERAVARGAEGVFLHVERSNIGAVALYAAAG